MIVIEVTVSNFLWKIINIVTLKIGPRIIYRICLVLHFENISFVFFNDLTELY